jgi:hypothetical protein
MWKETVLLEDHGDPTLFGAQIDLSGAAEQTVAIQDYLAAVRLDKPGQHAYKG